ncbi:MAG: bifunctional alpha,alpha-trehalose-phosphate synthase (UDP-forming)/trehalose-phosphatase [Fibrobacteria bacterium]
MSKLIVVSNRLPFTVSESEEEFSFTQSSGGLVSGLNGYVKERRERSELDCVWVGWPGSEVSAHLHGQLKSTALKLHSAHPVMLTAAQVEPYYHGFSNKTIWPLFHYLPSYAVYDESHWEAYQKANAVFRDSILEILAPGDTVWIHDYQLLLLPKMIRDAAPETSIGFFLHIPFPSFEIFRLLPSSWRKEILEGMLGADLIGFHTHDYTHYFLRSVYRTLGFEHNLGNISMGDKIVRADTLPLGIDFKSFHDGSTDPEVLKEKAAISENLNGLRLIFSVDRLDYTKGILQRLYAFELFLQSNPEWRGKVVFNMVVVPSREEVDQYHRMKKDIDELVGRINGAYGRMHWTPILYEYRSLSHAHLVALYGLSDVALITPLRDGMNLVAKEFLASRADGTGVLILSEMAGAARELGEALIVNPNHTSEVSQAILIALQMPREEQIRRNLPMQVRLRNQDAFRWATNFQNTLSEVLGSQKKMSAKHLAPEAKAELMSRYGKAGKRALFLDYDGTLIPFASHPQLAQPDDDLMETLKRLKADPANHVYVISGRKKETLQAWFGDLGIGLIGEHGVWIRDPDSEWRLTKPLSVEWKPNLMPIMSSYVERLPGSFIEEKEYSIAWHYRNSEQELGSQRAKELMDHLLQFTVNLDVQVMEGKKVIEVRVSGVNKGNAAELCRLALNPDFIFAVGDDLTDEDMFKVLPVSAYTVRIGMKPTFAAYNVSDYQEVRSLLRGMAMSRT